MSDEPSAADPLTRPRRSLLQCWITSPALTLSHSHLSSCRVDSSATGSRSDIEATIRFAEKPLQDKLVEHHFARRRIDLPESTCLHDGHSQPGHLEVFTPSTSDKRFKLPRIALAAWLFHSDDAVSLARHQRLFFPAQDWMNKVDGTLIMIALFLLVSTNSRRRPLSATLIRSSAPPSSACLRVLAVRRRAPV
jgi:hypothetical protein